MKSKKGCTLTANIKGDSVMATNKLETYRCQLCGNIVGVVHASAGELTCCGQAMALLKENTTEAATEKHIPVVEKVEGGYKVSVGSVSHPMDEKHYIEWIELIADNGYVYRKDLNPGDAPEAVFLTNAATVYARAYCNLHGYWKS